MASRRSNYKKRNKNNVTPPKKLAIKWKMYIGIAAGIATIIGTTFTIFTFSNKENTVTQSGNNNIAIVGSDNTIDNSTNQIINNYTGPGLIKELYPHIMTDYFNVSMKKIFQDFGVAGDEFYTSDYEGDICGGAIYGCLKDKKGYKYKLNNGTITFYEEDYGNSKTANAIEVKLGKNCKTYVKIPGLYIDVDTLKYALGISTFKNFYETIQDEYDFPIDVISSSFSNRYCSPYTYISFMLFGDNDHHFYYIGDDSEYYENRKDMEPIIPNHLFISN